MQRGAPNCRPYIARPRLSGIWPHKQASQMTDEALDIIFRHVIDGDDRKLNGGHCAPLWRIMNGSFRAWATTLQRDSLPLDKGAVHHECG